jgi:hypothetical protein
MVKNSAKTSPCSPPRPWLPSPPARPHEQQMSRAHRNDPPTKSTKPPAHEANRNPPMSTIPATHDVARLTAADLDSLETLLASALPAEAIPEDPDVVELGKSVTIAFDDGTTQRFVIAHTAEAVASNGYVSVGSPLGQAVSRSPLTQERANK